MMVLYATLIMLLQSAAPKKSSHGLDHPGRCQTLRPDLAEIAAWQPGDGTWQRGTFPQPGLCAKVAAHLGFALVPEGGCPRKSNRICDFKWILDPHPQRFFGGQRHDLLVGSCFNSPLVIQHSYGKSMEIHEKNHCS